MIIQLNTDNHIAGDEKLAASVSAQLERSLARFAGQITRIEVHFQDLNGERGGAKDKRCMLEARLAGHEPVAVTNTADTVNGALIGARDKLARVLEKHASRQRPPKGRDPFDQIVPGDLP